MEFPTAALVERAKAEGRLFVKLRTRSLMLFGLLAVLAAAGYGLNIASDQLSRQVAVVLAVTLILLMCVCTGFMLAAVFRSMDAHLERWKCNKIINARQDEHAGTI